MPAPRTKQPDYLDVKLRVDRDLISILDGICKDRMIGRRRLVEHLLRIGLANLPAALLDEGR